MFAGWLSTKIRRIFGWREFMQVPPNNVWPKQGKCTQGVKAENSLKQRIVEYFNF
jgi:hypothetical protein